MRRKVPSISSLTAFDAAARHLSITRAAAELSLTESAVSRQIAVLEEQLGVRLFHRIKKRISLTQAGAMYSVSVQKLMDRMERDTLDVMACEGDGAVLAVATLPTVGSEWLMPRLADFYARHPGVTVNVSARNSRFFFSETRLDCALYFGEASWPGARTDYLFDEVLVPVGSPALLGDRERLEPDEIVQHRLLHLETRPQAWTQWCAETGLARVRAMRGPRFDVQALLIRAASAGLGVALLPRFLIEEPLRAGALKVLSDVSVRSEGAYYYACPDELAGDPPLVAFRAWLLAQTVAFRGDAADGGAPVPAPTVLPGLVCL